MFHLCPSDLLLKVRSVYRSSIIAQNHLPVNVFQQIWKLIKANKSLFVLHQCMTLLHVYFNFSKEANSVRCSVFWFHFGMFQKSLSLLEWQTETFPSWLPCLEASGSNCSQSSLNEGIAENSITFRNVSDLEDDFEGTDLWSLRLWCSISRAKWILACLLLFVYFEWTCRSWTFVKHSCIRIVYIVCPALQSV